MRKVLAALIAIGIFYFFITQVVSIIPDFGYAFLGERVSYGYVHKIVKQDSTEKIEFGKSKGLEDGSANVVTSIVVNYRSFDTLGEVTVLLTAAIGVGILAGTFKKRERIETEEHFVLKTSTYIVLPLILLFGTYIFIHGHLTPGGGFPGGAILALGSLLGMLSNNEYKVKKNTKYIEQLAGLGYVFVGLLGMILAEQFLENFLPTGTIGQLFSAGIVPIVYILIGFKVGAELATLLGNMRGDEL